MNNYLDKLKDPRWQRKRLEVMQRDNFTCFDTGIKDEPLNVHHCHYSKGGPWETPTELLMTLTEDAHKKRQRLENRGKIALAKIFTRLPNLKEFEEDLKHFVEDLEKLAKNKEASPCLTTDENFYNESEGRWLRVAENHPEFREIYDSVIGIKRNWKMVDERLAKTGEKF